MIGAPGGLNSNRYNTNSKQIRKRKKSYLRKVNERWKTEYEEYLESNNPDQCDQLCQSPNNIKFWRDDSDSYNHSIRRSLLDDNLDNNKQSGNEIHWHSVWSADDWDHAHVHVYHPKDNQKDRGARLFQVIEEDQEKETTNRHTAQNRESTEK